jgi:hypothetical protein
MARPKTAIAVLTRLSAAAELASPARLGSAGIVFVTASVFRGCCIGEAASGFILKVCAAIFIFSAKKNQSVFCAILKICGRRCHNFFFLEKKTHGCFFSAKKKNSGCFFGSPRVSRSGPLEEVRVVHGSEGFLLAFLIFLCQKPLKKMLKNKNKNSKKIKKDTKKKHLIYQPTRYWGARLRFGHFFIF